MAKTYHRKRGGTSDERENETGEPEIDNRPYNARGSEAEKEAQDEKGSFACGGKTKTKARRRKRGGRAYGRKPAQRADKPRRAGGGRSPLSTAARVKPRPGMDESGRPASAQDD